MKDKRTMVDSHALLEVAHRSGKKCQFRGRRLAEVIEPVGAMPVIIEERGEIEEGKAECTKENPVKKRRFLAPVQF